MQTVNRKVTYRLYPNAEQLRALEELRALHCRVYNTLIEEHKRYYEQQLPVYSFSRMCKDLTFWRAESSLSSVNAQSLQVTAKRVSLAFAAFFRRIKSGEKPGYPRFKSLRRFAGWGYKNHGDGWRLHEGKNSNHRLRLSGVGLVTLRGRGRFSGAPKTCEIVCRNGRWFASVTFVVETALLQRPGGTEVGAFDWGVKTLLTIAKDDGSIETIDNPKYLKSSLAALKSLQRAVSREELKAKDLLGLLPDAPIPKGTRLPITNKLKRMYRQVASLHRKVANQRHNAYHQLTAQIVRRFGVLATEELDIVAMTKRPDPQPTDTGEFKANGAGHKAHLNRDILDSAPAKLISLLTYKAEEAGMWLGFADTKIVKPTQRCHCCGTLVPKELGMRWHTCPLCHTHCGRDENAAKTLLRWFHEGYFWSGTGLAVNCS